MTNEYESEMTVAEIVNALMSLWGADGLSREEAAREWTPGRDEDEVPTGEFEGVAE